MNSFGFLLPRTRQVIARAHFTSSACWNPLRSMCVVCLPVSGVPTDNCQIGPRKWSLLTFLNRFQTRLALHISGLGVSKMDTFHCFLDRFLTRLALGDAKIVTFHCFRICFKMHCFAPLLCRVLSNNSQ